MTLFSSNRLSAKDQLTSALKRPVRSLLIKESLPCTLRPSARHFDRDPDITDPAHRCRKARVRGSKIVHFGETRSGPAQGDVRLRKSGRSRSFYRLQLGISICNKRFSYGPARNLRPSPPPARLSNETERFSRRGTGSAGFRSREPNEWAYDIRGLGPRRRSTYLCRS